MIPNGFLDSTSSCLLVEEIESIKLYRNKNDSVVVIFVLLLFLFSTRSYRRVVKVKASDTDQKLIFTNFDKLLNFRSSDNRLLS